MKLRELLSGVQVLEANVDWETDIGTVVYDSRKAGPGSLFVAVTGFATDGNRFIPAALEQGAAVVLTARRPASDVPYIFVENERLALALVGANYYNHPVNSMKLIGVTGTNGKTSVTLLLKQVLEKTLDAKVGLIGTMANLIGDQVLPTERTTPESFELQGLFARMRDAGCQYAVMEVSSHAIALERVGGVEFDVAAFTNLTEDHLDFHGSMADYCDTKAKLFSRCARAVANVDDPWFSRITAEARCPVLAVSTQAKAPLKAENIRLMADGVAFDAVHEGRTVPVSVPIPGSFTVYNTLTVLGIALQLGISLAAAAQALKDVRGVKGRVEVVPTPGTDYTVLIDYAHTPDGLENVLSSVRWFCRGRLICVFGCGGDRDPIKRPIMGSIGVSLSDHAIITSDNPRSEAPEAILADILQGVGEDMGSYSVVPDRREAIRRALDMAQSGDIIILAGKGHETYQEINGVKYHLDEREEVAAYFQERKN